MKNFIYAALLIGSCSYSQIQVGNDIDGVAMGDESGFSTALSADGNILAVSSPENDAVANNAGQVRVFSLIEGNWIQLGNSINGIGSNDNFGASVKLSADGNILAIGSPNFNGSGNDIGQVRVFTLSGGDWVQLGNEIDGVQNNSFFGASISMSPDGNILCVGAPGFMIGASQSGQVKVYNYSAGNWTQLGNEINGGVNDNFFGNALALSPSGNVLAVSDFNYDGNVAKVGKVKVYLYSGGNWNQYGNIISGQLSEDNLRRALAFNHTGDILAVGIPGSDVNGDNSGKVQTYSFGSGNWNPQGTEIIGSGVGSFFGYSVDLSSTGTTLIVGAPGYNSNSGITRAFNFVTNDWTQIGTDIVGEANGDFFGISTALSVNNMVSIGGTYNDASGNNAGHVRIYNINSVLGTPNHELVTVEIFPNPAKYQVYLNFPQDLEVLSISIYSTTGKLMQTEITKDPAIVNVSHLPTGLYIIRIATTKGTISKNIIVE